MALTQEQINQWFTTNPDATQDDMAAAVKYAGGLESNPGLARSIAERFSVPESGVNQYYQNYTNNNQTGSGLDALKKQNETTPPVKSGLDTVAVNQAATNPIFDYFVKNQGKDDATFAADMRANKWTPEMVAEATGTPDKLADYTARFAAQKPPGLDTLATTKGIANPIFDYFKGLDPTKVASGALDTDIAAKMRGEKWTPGMVAQSTGTADKLADYTTRFGTANVAADKIIADKAAADKAATDKLSVFSTVYDPKTGRSFVSPAQALQYGITDYVTKLPMKLELLNSTTQKLVKDRMAGGKTLEQVMDDLGRQYKMTGQELYNNEARGAYYEKTQKEMGDILQSGSGGLKPEELIAKLQAYKNKPPTTGQEFEDQRRLYADYQNRYANSSWNYANMGGKAQDYSLKPANQLGMKFSGYSTPVNTYLNMIQDNAGSNNLVNWNDQAKIIAKNPEINNLMEELYKASPDLSIFNFMNPKYGKDQGSSGASVASSFAATMNNLAGNIEQVGVNQAIRSFVKQQQNELHMRPDAQGKLGNFNNSTMSNPAYRELNVIADKYTPKVSESTWNSRVKQETSGGSVDNIYRDPATGKGLAIQYNQRGAPQEIRFIDKQGYGTNMPMNDPAKLLSAFYESGMPLSAFTALQKAYGSEYLIPPPRPEDKQYFLPVLQNGVKFSDFANGNAAKVLASDSYLKDVQNRALADYQWSIKRGTPENSAKNELQRKVEKAVNDQKIAKAFIADMSKKK